MEIILIRKYFNSLENKIEDNELFKVVKDGFKGMNPAEILESRSLTAEEIGNLAKLLNSEEEVEDLKELSEKAFEEDPEAAADILGIPVYDRMPWEVYFPDEE